MLEKLREFDRVAGLLQMPNAERIGILNMSEEAYVSLSSGNMQSCQGIKPELDRRLSYALPLMRRLASTTPVVRKSAQARCGTRLQAA